MASATVSRKRPMANKIFKSIIAVALIVLFVTVLFSVDEMYRSFYRSQMDVLEAETRVIAYGIDEYGISFLDDLDETDYRITIIDPSGVVEYDNSGSDISSMDNHMDREEVKDAFEKGFGSSTRESSTLFERYIYTAVLLRSGDIVRLASTYPSVYHIITNLIQPLSIVILLIFVFSFPFAFHLTRRIVEPLDQIDVDNPDDVNCYREIRPVLKKLSDQQKLINRDREILLQKKQEFETITQNMNEGMVLLNTEEVIIDINKAAADLLEIDQDMLGGYISSIGHYDKIQDLIADASKRHRSSKRVKLNDRNYEFEISPVILEDVISGYVLLIFDESYKDANENMRKEFASNVSHELKTPLQTISGYAELLLSGLVKENDQRECFDKIYSEAQRMIMLVNDVIKLSHLDDEESSIIKENIDLGELCERVVEEINSEQKGSVTLEARTCEAYVYGNRETLEGIIYNLCENGIRYNREGGKVTAEVYTDDRHVYLKVTDTGIGIDKRHHERIFERFYRVDKARSKQVGGTGLGLSIVKHSCILNNATISLESEVGKGSTFLVTFNKADFTNI